MDHRGWEELDFIMITGDAYVDHASFGAALIARVLEADGYRVGVIAQPDWRSTGDFTTLGRPRYGFFITAGNMDSMVSNYTVAGKPRNNDVFSPGGIGGKRPDRATVVYSNRVRECFKGANIIIGGIEASLRRMGHYDFWSDKIRRSILLDSKADLLVYGMGELQVREIARRIATGEKTRDLRDIRGTVYRSSALPAGAEGDDYILLPAFDQIRVDKKKYAESFMNQYRENDAIRGKRLVEPNNGQYVIQNPPAAPMERKELDRVYALPFQRAPHPVYEHLGGVPAIQEVRFSLTSSRGCFGDCSFCALSFHQGRRVYSRSHESLEHEAKSLINMEGFSGYIHDVGGPTANFRSPSCTRQLTEGLCEHRQCLFPGPCKHLEVDHTDYQQLLQRLRALPGVKKVFVRSGIRYDYLLYDQNTRFLEELIEHHISGQLKVAPEHVDPDVLRAMGKPIREVFDRFADTYNALNKKLGKKQFLVPYFISSHPGSDIKAAVALAEYQRDKKYRMDQVQDFYPTPGTLSTCMYYTGLDPRTMKPVYVPKGGRERNLQRALLQYFKPENHSKVREALRLAGREDLIGNGKKCLAPPPGRRP